MAKKPKKTETVDYLLQQIVLGMQEKKAHQIAVMNLTNIASRVADYFVICHGKSDKQVEAISNSVEEYVHKAIKEWPWHVEGKDYCEWILIDYIHVVVHIFKEDKRHFYGIEELWGDAEITLIDD